MVLGQPFGTPAITNDGVTIARQIELGNIFENQAAIPPNTSSKEPGKSSYLSS